MPGTDAKSGVDNPLATAELPEQTGELAHEEGLATALSAFLSQLHYGSDEPHGHELRDPKLAASHALRASRAPSLAARDEVPQLGGTTPAGLTRRLPSTPSMSPVEPRAYRPSKSVDPEASLLPAPASPVATRPAAAQPPATRPAAAQPPATRPAAAHPAAAHPAAAHPAALRPAVPRPALQHDEPVVVLAQAEREPTPAPRPKPAQPTQLAQPPDLLPQHDAPTIVPVRGARRQRKATLAALALAVVAAAGLGVSVSWGYGKVDALNQRNQQLAATQASLATVQSSLAAAQSSLVRQHHDYAALKANIKSVAQRYVATKTELAKVQIELGQTQGQLGKAQGQLTQAQDQVGKAQSQLGNTQQNLSTTQSHATQIQRGAVLLQQTVQLLASLIVLENNYLTAAQAHNGAEMKSDLNQMRALDDQALTLEFRPGTPAP